jgi:quinolinate synthase
MLYKLQKDNPDKKFFLPTQNLVCANMKLITLGWVAHSLEKLIYEIRVSDDVRDRAKMALDRMFAVTGEKSGAVVSGY